MNDPFKKYRKQIRAWRNKVRLEREKIYYSSMFKEKNLSLIGQGDIKSEIGKRRSGIEPKPKGLLNIAAIYHHYNWEDYSLKPSLENFGTVRRYDWFEKFNHQMPNWHNSEKAKMNSDMVDRIKQWHKESKIDVIFSYLSGALVSPDSLRELSLLGIPMVNLSLNDKEYFVGKLRNGMAMGQRDICGYFDLCWTSTEDSLMKYRVEGAIPIYLPEGANPAVHRPYDEEKTIDVSFVGQCYGERPKVIAGLREKGIKVEAFGYGWPNGPLSVDEMVRLYSRSRINLGFGGVSDLKETYCLKGRDFEVPMSGGLYLTEYHPELERFFEIGKEMAVYSDFDDLVKKIRYFLSHPDEADAIRQSGYKRSQMEHTWEKRFNKVFKVMGCLSS